MNVAAQPGNVATSKTTRVAGSTNSRAERVLTNVRRQPGAAARTEGTASFRAEEAPATAPASRDFMAEIAELDAPAVFRETDFPDGSSPLARAVLVRKIGNSNGILLPSGMLRALGATAGTELTVTLTKDGIVLSALRPSTK